MNKNIIIWLAIFFFNLFSSFTHVAGKEAVTQIAPSNIAFFRSLLAVFVLWIMMRASGKTIFLERVDSFRFVILGALAVPMNQLAFISGLSHTPVSHPAVLYATTSAWVLIISVLIGVERLRWWKWVGVGFSIVGVFVLMGDNLLTFGDETIFGDMILLFAVLSWSLYTVICKPIVERYGALETTFLVMSFGALLYFPFGLFFTVTSDLSTASFSAWLGIIYMGVMTSGVAYFLWVWLLERVRPSQVAVVASAQPPTTALLAWFAFGEVLSLNLIISIVLVLFGIIFMVGYGGPKRRAGAEDS